MAEDSLQNTVQEFLSKIGISTRSLYRFKLGHGVVGKLSIVVIVTIVVIGAITCKLGNLWLATVAIIFIAFYSWYTFRGILKFADKYPDKALLEGAEFLIFHHKLPLGSKQLQKPSEHDLLPQAEDAGVTDIADSNELEEGAQQ